MRTEKAALDTKGPYFIQQCSERQVDASFVQKKRQIFPWDYSNTQLLASLAHCGWDWPTHH